MKKIALLTVGLLSFAFAQTQASEFSAEPAATAYWEIPLGVSKTGKEQQAFGFRMDQNVRDNAGNMVSSFASASRAPIVDFRFNASGMEGVYVRGINMAAPSMMKMGVEETVLWIVGGVTLGAAALIIEANDHGGSSNGNDCKRDFALSMCASFNPVLNNGGSCCS